MPHGTRRCCSEAVRSESAAWLIPPCDVWLIPHRCGNACVMYVADPAYVDTFHLETSRLCSSKIILSCQLLGHEMALAGGNMGKLLVLRVSVIELPDVGNRTPDRKLRVSGSATSPRPTDSRSPARPTSARPTPARPSDTRPPTLRPPHDPPPPVRHPAVQGRIVTTAWALFAFTSCDLCSCLPRNVSDPLRKKWHRVRYFRNGGSPLRKFSRAGRSRIFRAYMCDWTC